jgi:hypothetical protein
MPFPSHLMKYTHNFLWKLPLCLLNHHLSNQNFFPLVISLSLSLSLIRSLSHRLHTSLLFSLNTPAYKNNLLSSIKTHQTLSKMARTKGLAKKGNGQSSSSSKTPPDLNRTPPSSPHLSSNH